MRSNSLTVVGPYRRTFDPPLNLVESFDEGTKRVRVHASGRALDADGRTVSVSLVSDTDGSPGLRLVRGKALDIDA